MARVRRAGDPIVVGLYSKRGGVLRAVRRSGVMIARHAHGSGHGIIGHVKAGLTPRQVAQVWREKFPRTLREGGYVTHVGEPEADRPIVTEAQAAKRFAAKARREEKAAAVQVERDAAERLAREQLAEAYPELLAAPELAVVGAIELLRYAVGRQLGACSVCPEQVDVATARVHANAICCASHSNLVADKLQDVPIDGPLLARVVKARPEIKLLGGALRFLEG
jgi:hypothetical protein